MKRPQARVSRRLSWEAIDPVAVVRGASTAFTLLVLGGLAAPIAGAIASPLAVVWLPLVAVVAFAVAGCRAASSPWPPLGGAAAALSSYLLILPLVLLNDSGRDPAQIGATAGTALAVGALAAAVRTRLLRSRNRTAQSPTFTPAGGRR